MWALICLFTNHQLVLGHPVPNPGHNCACVDPAVQYSWQSSTCSKKLGYICYSKKAEQIPSQGKENIYLILFRTTLVYCGFIRLSMYFSWAAVETTVCSRPWIPYNGHCFYINRTQKTWPDAQENCRNEGGDLVSIHNVEDQSFIISQLGYGM